MNMEQDPKDAENLSPSSSQEREDQGSASATPEERIAVLEGEIEAMRDKWMRAEAEMQNLRTRSKRETEEARQYAVQKFARDIVEAAENLQRGLASLPPKAEDETTLLQKLREGLESTERSFVGILERNGIICEHPKGKPFDANLHQAMAEKPSDDHAPGTIVEAWTPTWTLHGRLLKPAMVVVARAQNSPSQTENQSHGDKTPHES